MSSYEPSVVAKDMSLALVKAARVVKDNFGKDLSQLGPEYKTKDGDTVRTIIDTYAEEEMRKSIFPKYPNAVYNLEESEIQGEDNLKGKLLFFGDSFDGTANAQPKLPLSTQGLIAAENGEFIAAALLHPFEKYMLIGDKQNGVYRVELAIDSNSNYHILDNTKVKLQPLQNKYEKIKSGKEVLMSYVDALYGPTNFQAERKAKWKMLVVENFDKGHNGKYNAQMMREMGSNIDAGMKLAEGRMHIQLTDAVGGIYDVAGNAVFMPLLGGVASDMYGNPIKVPETKQEMNTPTQQVIIASINPEIHEKLVEITQACYGPESKVWLPKFDEVIKAGTYPGFKTWNPTQKKILEEIVERKKL